MYFDEPAGTITGKADTAQWALLIIATVVISPLGYLLTGWLGGWADYAARALSGV
jgi:NADH-quinone oxidoreductase subunit N